MVLLMAVISYGERTQSKISKGKRWNQVCVSHGSHTGRDEFSQQWTVTTRVKCYQPAQLFRDSVAGFLLRPLVTQAASAWHHNFRLLEEKQVSRTNHIVCTNTLGTMSHHYE